MNTTTYRDMHLLDEVTRSPDVTQRELSRHIGAALGLTNLMIRRLVKKGYIKISGTKRSRIRYLITPQGILEKSRLTYEFIQYSFQIYSHMRRFLREQLLIAAKAGHRRIALCGTNELAEIAVLTIYEMGLQLTGVVDEQPDRTHFFGHPVKQLSELDPNTYDRMIVASLRLGDGSAQRLVAFGIPSDRLIILPQSGLPQPTAPTSASGNALPAEVQTTQPNEVEAVPTTDSLEVA